MTLSEQKKKRDLKYWQVDYLKYIVEFSVEFLKPKGKDIELNLFYFAFRYV